MKKFLIGTTALLGSLVFAQVAAAGDMKVTLGGAVEFQAGFVSQDNDNGQAGREFRTLPELVIKADNKADNGLSYGALVKLNNEDSVGAGDVTADELYMYGSGSFGRVELGDTKGASYNLVVAAPTVGDHVGDRSGQVDGPFAAFAGVGPSIGVRAANTDDSTKISYYTPRFSGFQAGLSYTPTPGSYGKDITRAYSVMNYKDAVETGVNYKGEFSGVKLGASAGFNFADAAEGSNLEKARAWQVGAQVGYQNFAVGAGYVDNGKTNNFLGDNNEKTAWNVGASYEVGAFGVAVNYLAEDYDNNGTYKAVGVGGVYKLAPGLTTGADVVHFKDKATVEEKGTVFLLSTKASF